MEYQVPQFIEVEDKIFGPFTLKQFIYIAGGAGLCTVCILYLPLFIGILVSIPIAAFAVALAFYKINNKTFVEILEAAFNYFLGSRLYLWKKETKIPTKEVGPVAVAKAPERQKLTLTQGKLQDLARSLDIKDQPDQFS